MNKASTFTLLVLFLTLTLTLAFAGDTVPFKKAKNMMPVREAFMERSPGTFNPTEYVQKQRETFDRLMAEAAPLAPESVITIPVSPEDLAGIDNYECETCGDRSAARKVRVGVVKSVGVKAVFNKMKRSMPDGGFAWTMALESPSASGLRVHFTDFSVGPDAEVYLYNAGGEAFGPYSGNGPGDKNDFWSHTVSGSLAFVQVRKYGNSSPDSIRFTIADIGFLGEKFLLPFLQQPREYDGEISTAMAHCNYNEACVEDASCYSGGAIADAKKSVAYMEWISGAWIYSCTGGLIADTDISTQIPYFLTANHCISRNKAANALECYFQYATANCGGACEDPVGGVYRTLGADVMDSSRDGDHTLLQLWEDPPAGSVFMGWTTDPMAYADGTHLFRISHPSGAPQAYSEHVVDSQYIECSGLPIGEFIYSLDVTGATEGGSSGSPVYNMSGQIVGQLYGACGYTLEICDFEQNRTVDGAFAFYYPQVAQWLDTGPPPQGDDMHVASIVLSTKTKGPRTDAIAKVVIVDTNGAPVSGAVVTGTFSGDASGTESGTTDASGEATIKVTVQGSIGSFGFCVDNVTLSGWTYDSAANVETCDTY